MVAAPADLAALLYEELVAALRLARRHTVVEHRSGRSAALTRTLTVLNLLDRGLDHARGREVAAALARWYDGLRRAVLNQVVRPDAERLSQLVEDAADMAEAWTTASTVWSSSETPLIT